VVLIDGMPALHWLEQARAFVSADNDYMAWAQLESQLPMFVWLARGEAQSFALVLGKADGSQAEVALPALSRAGFEAAAAKRPKTFELDWSAREARMLEDGLAYLRPGPFYDSRPDATDPWDTTDFESFIDDAFDRFIAEGTDRLLIDLRDNPGGDNSFSDLMIAWFADKPFRFSEEFDIKVSTAAIESNRKRLQGKGGETNSTSLRLAAAYDGKPLGSRVSLSIPLIAPRKGVRFTGPVYLLINRHSYSNTVLVAAVAQDYGFGTVLGEETSDLASTYGALEKFTLPRTGIEVSFPKARILRPNGDAQARGVIPDIAIVTPLADNGQDRVLQQAIKIIDGKQRALSTPK
jgi:C-terminal processing protease CtpA/Prc